ncbi:MAG TPA: outer membrane protein [Methylocella sp.]|nr:outer membrane protein [Methylocella sp.]
MAADLLPPPPPPPSIFTWTGVYVGGQIGYAWGAGNFNTTGFDPVTGAFVSGTLDNNPNGAIGGAHVGAQYQINQWVLGLEGSVDGTSLTNTAVAAFPSAFGGSSLSAQTSADVQGSIRGKVGFAWDRLLIYATGGVAFGGFSTNFILSAQNHAPPFYASDYTSSTRVGWTVGGGIQYALLDHWWVFAEYRFTDFGTLNDSLLAVELPVGAFFNGNRRLQENQVQVGFSYRFDLMPPPAPIVAKY